MATTGRAPHPHAYCILLAKRVSECARDQSASWGHENKNSCVLMLHLQEGGVSSWQSEGLDPYLSKAKHINFSQSPVRLTHCVRY